MGNIFNLKIQGPTDPSVDNPELPDNDSSTNENAWFYNNRKSNDSSYI